MYKRISSIGLHVANRTYINTRFLKRQPWLLFTYINFLKWGAGEEDNTSKWHFIIVICNREKRAFKQLIYYVQHLKNWQWGNQVQGSPGQLPCDPLLLTPVIHHSSLRLRGRAPRE